MFYAICMNVRCAIRISYSPSPFFLAHSFLYFFWVVCFPFYYFSAAIDFMSVSVAPACIIHAYISIITVLYCVGCMQPNNHNNFISTSHGFHGVHDRHVEWENVVIPQMHQFNQPIHPYQHLTNNHNSRHRMSYLIKSLAPSSNYEARVQARNDHGWNKLSSTFHFSTRAEGKSFFIFALFCYFQMKFDWSLFYDKCA